MQQSRRAFLTALVGVGGGCFGSRGSQTPTERPDRDGDGVPDPADDYPTDDRRAFEEFRTEGTVTLRPGEFSAIALTNSPGASGDILRYDVATGGDNRVDCLVFERDAYDAYADGAREVSIVPEYSRTGVTETTLTGTLDGGEYIFSLDYTSLVTAPGENSVTVHRVIRVDEPPGG